MTLTFFGQPQYSGKLASDVVGYELLIRQRVGNHWLLPTDLTALPPAPFERLLREAISSLPTMPAHISLNLERRHFVDPRFLEMILHVQADTTARLTVELTERNDTTVKNQEIIATARRYFEAGIDLCIDDIGLGDNLPGFVEALSPYVSSYKFNLQNLRQLMPDCDIDERFSFWYQHAQARHKQFLVAGIESLDEITKLRKLKACDIVQGYYFGIPVPLSTSED
ncbi:EAL domain-containing protein [Lacticaseibacillus sp. GG6-2]